MRLPIILLTLSVFAFVIFFISNIAIANNRSGIDETDKVLLGVRADTDSSIQSSEVSCFKDEKPLKLTIQTWDKATSTFLIPKFLLNKGGRVSDGLQTSLSLVLDPISFGYFCHRAFDEKLSKEAILLYIKPRRCSSDLLDFNSEILIKDYPIYKGTTEEGYELYEREYADKEIVGQRYIVPANVMSAPTFFDKYRMKVPIEENSRNFSIQVRQLTHHYFTIHWIVPEKYRYQLISIDKKISELLRNIVLNTKSPKEEKC